MPVSPGHPLRTSVFKTFNFSCWVQPSQQEPDVLGRTKDLCTCKLQLRHSQVLALQSSSAGLGAKILPFFFPGNVSVIST